MKKFLIKISYTVLPVWLSLVSAVIYISIWICPQISGDIGKLAVIPFGHEYDKMLKGAMLRDTLFQTIIDPSLLKGTHIDALTIGDSFSRQRNGGYQNYLSANGLHVVNFGWGLPPMQTAYNLMNLGYVDSTNVKTLIVECVERGFVGQMKSFDPDNRNIQIKEIKEGKAQTAWSLLRARDFILFKIGYHSPIFKCILNKDLFTSSEPRSLYFYRDDIKNGVNLKRTDAEKVRAAYDNLISKANEKHIRLILLVAVDKYDLYQNFIVDNPYPRKTINEDLKKVLGGGADILFAKDYLLPYLEKGERDVFMYHDTHWSYKGSRIVAEELYKRIKNDMD